MTAKRRLVLSRPSSASPHGVLDSLGLLLFNENGSFSLWGLSFVSAFNGARCSGKPYFLTRFIAAHFSFTIKRYKNSDDWSHFSGPHSPLDSQMCKNRHVTFVLIYVYIRETATQNLLPGDARSGSVTLFALAPRVLTGGARGRSVHPEINSPNLTPQSIKH